MARRDNVMLLSGTDRALPPHPVSCAGVKGEAKDDLSGGRCIHPLSSRPFV